MANLEVPYPGYNWNITQHMGMANQESITELLRAADLFKGQTNFSELVSSHMLNLGIFTENVRSDTGQSDTWRDYQQVLSELGLIVSTSLTRSSNLSITPIGLLFLDEELSYQEMMATQAMRYQYPNGYKGLANISRAYASDRGIPNRWMLDTLHGVKVKPAILILRALIDLYLDNPEKAKLTASECATALIPIITHDNPKQAYENIIYVRKNNVSTRDSVLKRNAAEWFSLLLQTGMVVGNRREIQLSPHAIENLQDLQRLCEMHESLQSEFWIPAGSDSDAFDWFSYYGLPSTEIMSQRFEGLATFDAAGFRIDDMDQITGNTNLTLELVDFVNPPEYSSSSDSYTERSYSEEAIREGIKKRTEAGRRHEDLVGIARQKMLDAGFSVYKSAAVDLLGTRDDQCLIVEVKTITRKNLISQTRKGLMQLGEYRYRYQDEYRSSNKPETLLLLSSKAQYEQWRIGFMDSLDIGCANINADSSFSSCVKRSIADSVFLYAS